METFEIVLICVFGACVIGVLIGIYLMCRRKKGGSNSRSYRKQKEEYANQLCAGLDGEGVYALAQKYKEGEGVERDIILSEELVKKSAELGYAKAQYDEGCRHDYFENDVAIKWFEKAAAQGYEDAIIKLGDIYNFGRDGALGDPVIKEDPEKALKYYLPIAEKGNVEVMKLVSLVYTLAYDDDENALKWRAKAAEATGKLEDIKEVAENYSMNDDFENSVIWYKKAAELGDIEALYNIGIEYERMDDSDPAEVTYWFEKAIAAGYTEAEVTVAFRCLSGETYKKDENKAFKLFSKHAELGDDMALYGLGLCYRRGAGVSKDDKKAFEYFEKANNFCSRPLLAKCYLEGVGVEKNEQKGFEILAEENKDDHGGLEVLYLLGECYFFGKGAESDKQKAKELWKKCAEYDDEDSIAALDKYFGITVNND